MKMRLVKHTSSSHDSTISISYEGPRMTKQYTSIGVLATALIVYPSVKGITNSQHNKTPVHQQSEHGSLVGFTAWKQSRQEVEAGDKIVFDGIILNEGNHYDIIFNWFECPYNGVYFFSATLRGDDTRKYTSAILVKDSVNLLTIYTYNPTNPLSSASNSGLIRCSAGERLWLEAAYDDGVVNGQQAIHESTFTVFMINNEDFLNVSTNGAEYKTSLEHGNIIGFTAFKTTVQDYVTGDRIIYEQTLINEGGHYIPQTSQFQCPINGIYYISISSYYGSSGILNIGIALNSLFSLHSRSSRENRHKQVSSSRLLQCDIGDHISVRALAEGAIESGSPSRTTFTVMLMYSNTNLNTSTEAHSSFVGFTAFKKDSQNYLSGDTIIFDAVLLNEGDHYQPLLGRFICPAHGIYFVEVTVKRLSSDVLFLDVEHATNSLFRLSSTDSKNPGDSIHNSALVRCFTGEQISVKGAGQGSVYGNPSETDSIFTVMIMYQY